METVNIYHLSHKGNVFYVGATKQPLNYRLSGHNYESDFGVPKNEIEITLLEVCSLRKATKAEDKWMKYYRDLGVKLSQRNRSSYVQTLLSRRRNKRLQSDFDSNRITWREYKKQRGY